jgi:hypothetical protein
MNDNCDNDNVYIPSSGSAGVWGEIASLYHVDEIVKEMIQYVFSAEDIRDD